MVKWGLSALMVAGLLLVVVGFAQYSSSGTQVAQFDLKPERLNQGQLQLAPSMNAMRAILATRYRNRSNNLRVTHYDYQFSVSDMKGTALVTHNGSNFETYKETPSHHQRTSIRRNNHILSSWEVLEDGIFTWQVSFTKRQAQLESAQLIVKQNVMTSFPTILPVGAVMMVVGFVLLIVTGRANRVSG